MEHARIETPVDGTTPYAARGTEVDDSEDGSPPVRRTTQGPQRWIERPHPKMS